jgi:uncharacterized beta-barrel protein YwiB (DUF1934 family)
VEKGEDAPIEVLTPGMYYSKNGKQYLLYDDIIEGVPGGTHNTIKITGKDQVEMLKSGKTNTHMLFQKGKKNLAYYQTPFGQLLIGVNTQEIELVEEENLLTLSIQYELDLNHEPVATCDLNLKVFAKGMDPFRVTVQSQA